MRVSTVFTTLGLAIGAIASPMPQDGNSGDNGFAVPASTTIGQAGDVCGSNTQLSCCNTVSQTGDSTNVASGILSGLLQGVLPDSALGLFSGCSKISVPLLIGIDDLLDHQCQQTAACCSHDPNGQSGLVNVGIPCVALSGLL